MAPEVIAAIISSVCSVFLAVVAVYLTVVTDKFRKRLDVEYKQKADSAEFIAEKLDRLYVPVAMNLAATNKLFDRFGKAGSKEQEAIEKELRTHNSEIKNYLMKSSMYLEPDAPGDMISDLIKHYLQWEIVFKLKYEYGAYDGPVFAGIKEFGFEGFPKSADTYFSSKMNDLRKRHHARLQEVQK